jgi:hypothetical protein
MGMVVEDNFDEALSSIRGELPSETHELTLANVMEYAVYLHDMKGFFVFNDGMLRKVVVEKLKGLDEPFTDEAIEGALQTAAAEYVNWLVDLIAAFRPPLRPSEAPPGVPPGQPRKARQGRWADRTGNLAAHYKSQVDDGEVVDHDGAAPEPAVLLPEQTLSFPD